ncbi:hypothetical protein LC082_08520 [Microbacterium esteraromaticum]|uniref:hypothetical protein n=1 Tax=Microbacterium esteraromaticum TaxID=57043 RepID=UPI001CD2FB6F|nr:hypothetical protein [Microbacterium esteraromaticum]MCA1306941.1 hypothetical protein [Microbacterium esteraromaticum]
MITPTGILLPESLLYTDWFGVLATFVAINTVIYVVLGVIKMTPKIRWGRRTGANRRSQTRSIHPDAAP